jgi:hypothetical protein
MKQSNIFIYLLLITAAIIFIAMVSTRGEICTKKEYIKQESCPDQQKNDDDIFINPINKFIVMV